MRTTQCQSCTGVGYCLAARTPLTLDHEMKNSDWVRNFRTFCYFRRVDSSEWHDYLVDLHRDIPGRIYVPGRHRVEFELILDMFDKPGIEYWFKEFCNTLPEPDVRCHVRVEARPRVAVMSTILRAHFPVAARLWPREVANDNEPPANDDEPAVHPRHCCTD